MKGCCNGNEAEHLEAVLTTLPFTLFSVTLFVLTGTGTAAT